MTSRPRPPSRPGAGSDLPLLAPATLVTAAAVPLLAHDGRIEQPLLLVDLEAPPEDVAEAARAIAASDRVLVGVARAGTPNPHWNSLLAALDLTLVPAGRGCDRQETVAVPDPGATALALRAAALANPQATTVLAGLLRWSGPLDVRAALDAESLAYSTLLGGPEFAEWLGRRGPRPLPPPAPEEPVLLQREGGELRVTLNRPRRRNAYGRELRDALVSALHLVSWDDSIDRVVLDGAGPNFCSGGDLDEFGTAPDPVTAHLVRTRAGAALPLYRVADRVEAQLHGACVGAGIELPAYVHRVVAAPDTRLLLPEIGMGLIPGAGGTVSIPRRIGRWRTLYLAMTGEFLDAETALSWGLVDEVR
jgi:hypothetical protein